VDDCSEAARRRRGPLEADCRHGLIAAGSRSRLLVIQHILETGEELRFYEPIILPEKASREVQLTLHPPEDGGKSKFQVHSRPYGERGAEWSLNADGTVVTGVDDEPLSEHADPVDEAIERQNRMRPQELFETFADMELA